MLPQEWTKDTAVLITAYNRPLALEKTVSSIRKLFPEVSIFIGDNSTKPPAEPFRKRDRVVYIRLQPDFGLSATRNYLVDVADRAGFEFVLFCDDDFIFDERSNIQELRDLLDQGWDLASGHMARDNRPMCAGRFEFTEDGGIIHHLFCQDGDGPQHMDFGGTLLAGHVSTFQKCRWDDRLKVGEHFDFYVRANRFGLKHILVPRVAVQDGDGETDGRQDKEYMEDRNRARVMFRQSCTRLAEWVEMRPVNAKSGQMFEPVELPEPIEDVRSGMPVPLGWIWPSLEHVLAKASERQTREIRKLLWIYNRGGNGFEVQHPMIGEQLRLLAFGFHPNEVKQEATRTWPWR